MIFNRTVEDVSEAIKIRESKIKRGEALTEEENSILEKGFLTLNTIKRIEEKQAELSQIFQDMGYYSSVVNVKAEYSQFFKEDLTRIVDNEKKLQNAFYVFLDTPTEFNSSINFENFNSIEKILYDLEEMSNYVKSKYKMCGTFTCGGTN